MAPKKLITKGTPSAAVDADADLGITATSPPPSHVPRSLALKTTPMAPRSAKVDADAVLVTTAASPPPSHVPRSSAPKTASIAPSSAEVEADAVVGVTAASHLGPLLLHSAVPTTAADLRSVSVDAVKYDHGAEAIDPERGRIRGNENDTTGAGAAAANDRDRLKVGTEFVEKYYKSLVSSPHSLHTFYNLQCQVSWTIHGKSFNMKSPTDVQNMMADKTSRGHFSFQGHELHLSKHTIHVVAWGVNILDSTSSNFVQSFMLRPRNRSCSILSDVMFVMMNVPQGSLEIKAGSTLAVKAAPNVRPQKIKIIPYLPRHAAKIAPNDSKVAAIEGAQHSEVLLIYNKACQLHAPAADVVHVENPSRMIQIIDSLKADGVLNRVVSQESDPADRKYVQAVHGEKYMEELIDKLPLSAEQLEACPYISKRKNEMYSSDGTKEAVFLAAGAVIKACDSVAKGHFKKSFALVRPPGHHASTDFSEGFCYVNNAAVGVKYLQNQLGLKRVMVVDIDVHHGNGSQSIFFEDDSVLFFSTHCNLLPYPNNKAAMNYTHIGHGKGKGFNVNVPLEIGFGDADILYVLDHALAPLVKMFQPQKILVSAGFDAAQDDPLGRCKVRPRCFGTVTKKLVELGDGNLIMCLEGGYGETLGECVSNSVRSLLGDKDSGLTAEELRSLPAPKLETIETVQKLNKRLKKSQKDKKCGAGDK